MIAFFGIIVIVASDVIIGIVDIIAIVLVSWGVPQLGKQLISRKLNHYTNVLSCKPLRGVGGT